MMCARARENYFPEMGVNITGWLCCSGVTTCNDWCGGGGPSLAGMVTTGARSMAGIRPGVLLRICHWCVCFILMRFCFAVGLHVCIIAGLFDTLCTSIWGVGVIGVPAVTLCFAVTGGGIITTSRWAQRILIRAFPFRVLRAFVVSVANFPVSAFKCLVGLRFGTWQCCGKSSAEPNIQYGCILGT